MDLLLRNLKTDWSKAANLITELRFILCPLPSILLLYGLRDDNLKWLSVAVFILVVATDALDGYVARSRNEVTDLGKLLDPLVDKVAIVLTMITLSFVNPFLWVPTLVIIFREVAVTYLRSKAANRGVVVPAMAIGKLKMVAQSVMAAMLLAPIYNYDWWLMTVVMTLVAVAITLISWFTYSGKFSERKA